MITKRETVAEMLMERVERGDYTLNSIPSARILASELGISYVTTRRALQMLIDSGHMQRTETGRMQVVAAERKKAAMRIAFVTPSFSSLSDLMWFQTLQDVVDERGGIVRPVSYTHNNDSAILSVLDAGFDGVILFPPYSMSKVMINKLAKHKEHIVTMEYDLTRYGIPCIDVPTAGKVDLLIEHLAEQGHKIIDCISVAASGQPIVTERIEQWRKSLSERGLQGELYRRPSGQFDYGPESALKLTHQLLQDNKLKATAVFCPTLCAAKGFIRGIEDAGFCAGRDIAVCSFSEEREARMMVPSVTVVETPKRRPLLGDALCWFEKGGEEWNNSFMIRPHDKEEELFIGESTRLYASGFLLRNRNLLR